MKKIASTLLPTLTGTFVLMGGVESALAINFTTTFTLSNPSQQDFVVTSAVFTWETNTTSGNITSANLTNLTLQLFGAGNSLFFTDAIIVNGVAQAIGGESRSLSDIFWDFDFNTGNANFVTNSYSSGGTSGTTYIANAAIEFGDPFNIFQYVDGSYVSQSRYASYSQTTVPQPVPEPVTILGTLLAGGLGVAFKKKTKL